MGGFITSAVLVRTAEHESLRARINLQQDELSALSEYIDRAQITRERHRATHLLEDALDEVVDIVATTPLTTSEAQRRLKAVHIVNEAFAAEWEQLAERVAREARRVSEDLDRYGEDPEYFAIWVAKNGIDLTGRDEILAHKAHRTLLRARHPQASAPGDDVFGAPLPNAQHPEWTQWRISVVEGRNRELESDAARITDLEHRRALVQAELQSLSAQLQTFQHPRHVWWGLGVLLILTLFGIVLPLMFMPQDANSFRSSHKIIVIGGFLFGLLTLFIYVAILLRRKSPG